ncbi:FAD-dependent monooxygenase [Phytomonospora endophytica]|uniref:2-polyprenyl-6-methoxyphenol hydroxylase-like FAD-dependent oxidoreductase n=1 Tax=Phytomonospora endophytica TaxID=714109 RepID=A0A841FLQ5_9ACTN|nr:FAD-dependent monooxygenase [Phytomonospora endophytica]MBB6034472.1 2-polyprenyl-6-methoxyphenol hydroxylase-like FAD-dependent oxidoreductase [Phytomonospora endophytica]GIG70378.1 oxidoreductase [Phytomonospora endophytica]
MDVLISGAGVAGPTLAHFLARAGHRPTVVELAADLRSSGNPVDVRGEAVDVAESMGVMRRLREAATDVDGLRLLGPSGRPAGYVDMRAFQGASGSREVEIPRGDLASVLYEAGRDDAEYVFGDSIASLSRDADGVDVTFRRGAPRRFGLVVGADGLHSTTRRLAFGPEADYVRGIGMYVAGMPVDEEIGRDVIMYNVPGRMLALHPSRGRALAAFIFRHPPVAGLDSRDIERQRDILTAAYAHDGWRVPELLDRVRAGEDLYFDAVSRVEIDSWTRGRVTLLGDASSSVSLFGDGSSSAMVGARTLAEELSAGGDLAAALRRYEERHRKVVGPRLRNVGLASHLLVPGTRAGVAVRNLATRLSPVVAAGRRLAAGRRRPAPV